MFFSQATLQRLRDLIASKLTGTDYVIKLASSVGGGGEISVSKTVLVKMEQQEDEEDDSKEVMVSWGHTDEALGSALLAIVQNYKPVT